MNFNRGGVGQVEALRSLPLDQPRQHRHFENGAYVSHDYTRLPPVGRDHHHRGPLAGGEISPIVVEAGDVHADKRQNEGFSASAANNQPGLPGRVGRWDTAIGALIVNCFLLIGHLQSEGGGEEREPSRPVAAREPGREEVWVSSGL